MKQTLLILGLVFLLVMPSWAPAADHAPLDLPAWTVSPFVLMLLCIAILPLITGKFWHSNLNKLLVSVVLAVPVAAYLIWQGPATNHASTHALVHELTEYFSFIVLLGSLYTVSGGIVLSGDIEARPLTNVGFLAFGAVLANFIGTTGASMLLIRPLLRINSERKQTRHLPIFFIFVVSNLGGLLTPLGDPPLFLGFLRGVDFFWTLSLWPQWLMANGLGLLVFFLWDTRAFHREPVKARFRDIKEIEPIRVRGLVNLVFLAGIIAAVLLHSDKVAGEASRWLSQFFPCPNLTLHRPAGELAMIAMALLSLWATPRELRKANAFTWSAIIEVAVLFAGIFITMVPALELLRGHGRQLGVERAWEYFWLTGGLSSVLDNAPTYLVFATVAASPNELDWLLQNKPLLLSAISCGAVFMGANTYIGNGPNFMVKAIADEAGYKMPSFFGYLLYSGCILLPVFVVLTFVFYW